MKTNPMGLLALLVPLAFSGCAAVATTSAVVVGGALAPAGGVYHAVSGDIKKAQARVAAMWARLDPICEKKIEAIVARAPAADATALWSDGVIALLPSVPGERVYPGLDVLKGYDSGKVAQNRAAAAGSPSYRELESLMNPLSEDFRTDKDEPGYFSPTFQRFLEVEWEYKRTFNRTMYNLVTEAPRRSASGSCTDNRGLRIANALAPAAEVPAK